MKIAFDIFILDVRQFSYLHDMHLPIIITNISIRFAQLPYVVVSHHENIPI